MKKGYTTWLSIPREYVQITSKREQFESYVDVYFERVYPGWKPIKYMSKKTLAKWEGIE